jgi:molybdate transport system regulatory protein
LSVGGQDLGGPQRIGLLRAIAEQGTLTAAAQALGISYKGAWDALNAMNAHAGQPLVERVTGGRGGGSTRLTPHALRLVERYEQIEAVHQRFMRQLSDSAMDLDEPFSLLKVLNMKTSARNQWVGVVGAIRAGAVNDEVELQLPGGARVVAIITRESTEALGLRLKQPVIALVKASAVLLAAGLGAGQLSARNRFEGRVVEVSPGAVNAEVSVQTDSGVPVVAIVNQASVGALGLAPGAAVSVLFQASDVILATTP